MVEADNLLRYSRQIVFSDLALAGQRALMGGRALVVGAGGLGTWTAELLARAGVGLLRLVDDDNVDLTNIHRQGLYDESDAAAAKPKVQAAAERLGEINSDVAIEAVIARVDRLNLHSLAQDVDLILDGTDNFETRFLINDYAVKYGKPWIFAGVVGAEGQIMAIVPGSTPCLRCVMDCPPPPCSDPDCRSFGVLGPAVSAIASFQAIEAVKILSGAADRVNPCLIGFDMWNSSFQRIGLSPARQSASCICCVDGKYEFLEPC